MSGRATGALALLASIAGCLAGCEPELGTCDDLAARTLYYADDTEGFPMYAGQALVYRSCGGEAFCHTASVSMPASRYGAPKELDFDVALADGGEDAHMRLAAGLNTVYEWRHNILDVVQDGEMPPQGIGLEIRSGGTPFIDNSGRSLPEVDTPAGEEILRNWLACAMPVVERTNARPMGLPMLGTAMVPARPQPPPDPSWPSIFENVIGREDAMGTPVGCSRAACHNSTDNAGMLDLSTSVNAYLELFMMPAEGTACASGGTRVVASNADDSLLIHKLEGIDAGGDRVCGDLMPQGRTRPISEDVIGPIREWIDMGALEM